METISGLTKSTEHLSSVSRAQSGARVSGTALIGCSYRGQKHRKITRALFG